MMHRLKLCFRHIRRPNFLIPIIDKETKRIQARHPSIRGFTVNIDEPHRKRYTDSPVRVQVSVSLLRRQIVVTKEADGASENDNAATALNHAFAELNHAVDQYQKKKRSLGYRFTAFKPILSENPEMHISNQQ